MKLLHFSDTHLGFSEYNKIDPESGINQREQDFYNAWDQVIDAILAEKPDIVVHAGDLFHTPRPCNRAIRVAFEGIKKISDAQIPMVIVSGNHETPRIRSTGSIYESIALFENVYLAYLGKYIRFNINGVHFHCLPHCSLSDELHANIREIELAADADLNILVAHGAWSGNNFYGMGEFNEQRLPDIEASANTKFDYVALGHYHKHIRIKDHIYYSGATERTSLNEQQNTCGYLIVDLESGEKSYRQINARKMIRLPLIDCREMSSMDIYDCLAKMKSDDLENGIVYLQMDNIPSDTFLKIDMRTIDEIFSGVFHLEKHLRRLAQDSRLSVSTHIESLDTEFERYLDQIPAGELDTERLKTLAFEYLNAE